MNDYIINIRQSFINFAEDISSILTPGYRTKGFKDNDGERGVGDYLELLARITIFNEIGSKGKVCDLALVSGEGDLYDLAIRHQGRKFTWDIKASAYLPYREGLKLFIKEETLSKRIDGYVQTFVHLAEDDSPHLHIAGVISTTNPIYKRQSQNIINIPVANYPGIEIPVERLSNFEVLLDYADPKW